MKKRLLAGVLIGLLWLGGAGGAQADRHTYRAFDGVMGYQDIKVDEVTYIIVYITPVVGRGRFRILINPEPFNFYRSAQLTLDVGYGSFKVLNTSSNVSESYYVVSRTIKLERAPLAVQQGNQFDARMVMQALEQRIASR
ncbi:MAG: hypothetical protein OEW12_04155 [Deltaproteobacteria bacterium]|nr:hypothetical protein [Deltaproteobacteria bacterium]